MDTKRWGEGQVNPFWLMAGLYVTVALFFAILRGAQGLPGAFAPSNLNWLRVHFITIGTILQVIFGALPGIVARRLGGADRSHGETWLQWALVNGGFVLIVTGIAGVDAWTAAVGAGLIFVAVYRLLQGLFSAFVASGRRWRESMRFFLTAPFYLLTGITAAFGLLFNWWAPGGRIGYLEAHVHANVWGFLALIVAGMLFELFPAVVGRPMARPQWLRPIYLLLNSGAVGLVIGPLINIHAITIGGLAIYFVGTAMLILNLILTLVGGTVSPSALHMVLAYLWMVVPAFFAPFILLTPDLLNPPAVEAAAVQGLINGWVLGIVMGALPRLLRTRGAASDGPLFGTGTSREDGCWLSVIALNLGVALVWISAVVTQQAAVMALTAAGYALIAVAWVPHLRRTWRLLL